MSDETQKKTEDATEGAATEERPAQPEAADAAGDGKASFEMDPALAAAMKEAESAYERRRREESGNGEVPVEIEGETGGDPALPTGGAGEGTIRALAEMRKALDALEKSEAKVQALEDQLKRTAADFDNFRKRMQREREEDRKFAIEKLLKELLPVIDNMERALESATNVASEADTQLVTGVKMVHKLFLDTLKKFGVEQFSAKGQPFDPEKHEAMQAVESEEVPPGHVAQEYMKGYYLNERLVRPAMVAVAKAPESGASGAPSGDDDQSARAESATGESAEAEISSPVSDAGGEGEVDE